MRDIVAAQSGAQWKRLLFLVLGIALAARLWGIDYGLPFSYWTDEYHELMRAMQLGAGSFNFARTSKGGFYLLLFVEYGIYFVVLRMTGIVANAQEFAELFVRDPTMFYLIGRTTAVAFGCITVAAVFWLARAAYSSAAGLLAALLLAINALHVGVSHRIGVDVPMTMFATLSLWFGLRLMSDGRRRDYVLAALFAAFATTTKLPGVLVLVPLLIAHTYAVSRLGGGIRGWLVSRNLWLAAAVFAVVLLATNPGFLFYTKVGAHVPSLSDDALDANEEDTLAELGLKSRPNLYLFYLGAVLDSMGWPLFLLSLAALAYAVWRRTRPDIVLVSYALINYLAISVTAAKTLYYPRYALPIIVVLTVLTGRMLSELIHALPRWRLASAAVMVAAVAAWPIAEVVTENYSLTQTDTRTIAKNWIEANVPAGSKVLIEGGKAGPKRESVQLRESSASLGRRIAYWKDIEPRQAKFLEVKLVAQEGTGYDLELVRKRDLKTLDEYAAAGVEYFVVRPQNFAIARKADSTAASLLNELRTDPRVELIRRFEPESPSQPGVAIEIYRLKTDVDAGTS